MTRKLVIDRARWFRGKGADDSRLLRSCDGRMCCLGIYLEACGVPSDALENTPYPSTYRLRPFIPAEAQWLLARDSRNPTSSDAIDLATTNDRTSIKARTREERIRAMFAKHDVEVVFVGGRSGPEKTAAHEEKTR